jgi:hypothetical protein
MKKSNKKLNAIVLLGVAATLFASAFAGHRLWDNNVSSWKSYGLSIDHGKDWMYAQERGGGGE